MAMAMCKWRGLNSRSRLSIRLLSGTKYAFLIIFSRLICSWRENAAIKSFTYKTPTTLSMEPLYTGNREWPLAVTFCKSSSCGVSIEMKSTSMRGTMTSFTEVSERSSTPLIMSFFSSANSFCWAGSTAALSFDTVGTSSFFSFFPIPNKPIYLLAYDFFFRQRRKNLFLYFQHFADRLHVLLHILFSVVHAVQVKQAMHQEALEFVIFINFKIIRIFGKSFQTHHNVARFLPFCTVFVLIAVAVLKAEHVGGAVYIAVLLVQALDERIRAQLN